MSNVPAIPQKIAVLLRKDLENFTGEARLYRLSPSHETHEYVVVSATEVMFSGPETYIFGADCHGEVLTYQDLQGSTRGVLDHELALHYAGYDVINPDVIDGEIV